MVRAAQRFHHLLVPVLPDDSFYEAVVAAASVLSADGEITFFFWHTQPPEALLEDQSGEHPSEESVREETLDEELEAWRDRAIAALDEARDLLEERGITNVSYRFGDDSLSPELSLSEEIERASYDAIVLPEHTAVDETSAALGPTTDDLALLIKEEFSEIALVLSGPGEAHYVREQLESPHGYGEEEERIHQEAWAESGPSSGID